MVFPRRPPGTDAAQRGEGGLAAQAIGVVAGGDEQSCGGIGSDAVVGQQRGGVVVSRCAQWRMSMAVLRPDSAPRRAGSATTSMALSWLIVWVRALTAEALPA
jgi:hypothetical protein